MIDPCDVTGVILAGGRSRRMGTDKAMLDFHGVPFIRRIADVLLEVFPRVVVSCAAGDGYSFLSLPEIKDIYPDCGPLGGIHAALRSCQTPYIFVLSCDVPFISKALVHDILVNAESGTISIAEADGQIHPLIGLYPQHILPRLSDTLKRGHCRMTTFINGDVHRSIDVGRFRNEAMNINSPEDYRSIDPG